MSPAEYSELSQAKERAADLHRLRKLHFRERIADAIQANPEWAYTIAQGTLNKETAVWQQWSRAAWKTLLASKNPKEIARILTNHLEPQFEALADSHPFAACLTLQSHGR
jgi:hypothetical protein